MRTPRREGTGSLRRWLGTTTGSAMGARAAAGAMWCLVACGPLALLATAVPHSAQRDKPAASQASSMLSAIGPGGFAQMYVAAYLRSGGTNVSAFFPDAPAALTQGSQTGSRQVALTAATAVTQVSPGYWSITVAADEPTAPGKDAGLHYFEVPVAMSGTKEYVATALPAEIAAPAVPAEPQPGYDTATPVTSGPLPAAVNQFLDAYLTGSGNLSRYLSPGTALAAPSPAPYAGIQAVTIYQQTDKSTSLGADTARTAARVLAEVQATDNAGQQWPLTYALTLTMVAGQWDVSALDPAPALAASPAGRTAP